MTLNFENLFIPFGTYASREDSFSLYFLGYVPDFNDVLVSLVSSCSIDVETEEIPLLELLRVKQHYLEREMGKTKT